MRIEYEVHGAQRVANHLRHWAAEFPDVIHETIGAWCKDMARHLSVKAYPPERIGQTYVRTFTLPTGWGARDEGPGHWTIFNDVDYSGWVVNAKTQAWMHVGRWWTYQDEVQPSPDLRDALVKDLNKVISK